MDWLSGKCSYNSSPVMVAVVSSNPTEGNLFLLKLFKTLNVNFVQKCLICVEKENLDCVHNTRIPTLPF